VPVPDAWFGIKDEEERFRRRYLDILLNPEVRAIVEKRSLFWNTIRTYLLEKSFIEVETPVLETTTGGADARPFITHHNALDIDVYLRISAGELWQKKLLVSGIPRTFEIGRIFRNEGMSNEHLQDYTQLEYYMAYADFYEGMEMTKELYRLIADKVFGTREFTIKGHTVDFNADWIVYDFCEEIKKAFGVDPLETSIEEVKAALAKAEIDFDPKGFNIERGVDLLWKKIRKQIAGPGFLVGVPVYLEPLAKRSREDTRKVERFQVLLAGSEMGKGFSELNDPIDQRQRFEHQQALRDAGDDEAQMADMEYVEALEYGMPPAFGFGLSERLLSFLLDLPVREAQIFPLMRPRGGDTDAV
jgi:lysyl-tRNA synthetase class 2